jgi:hypothetical protein
MIGDSAFSGRHLRRVAPRAASRFRSRNVDNNERLAHDRRAEGELTAEALALTAKERGMSAPITREKLPLARFEPWKR